MRIIQIISHNYGTGSMIVGLGDDGETYRRVNGSWESLVH